MAELAIVQTIRIVIADDHPLMRSGIRDLLQSEPDLEVVGEAASGEEALRLVKVAKPDVLLLDMNMPGTPGVEVARKLRSQNANVQVLALSAYNDQAYVAGLMECGAAGYVTKEQSPRVIIEAIRAVARGEVRWFVQLEQFGKALALISDREQEVLRLMARGRSNVEIAQELDISSNTVRNHVANIYAKLDVSSWREAVAWAWEHGLMNQNS